MKRAPAAHPRDQRLSSVTSAPIARREFLHHGALAAVIAAALETRGVAKAAIATASAPSSASTLDVIDYGRSFIGGKWPENSVRFWVESRTRIIDERSGKHEDFYQCASCKSEDTFAAKNLFVQDNYDFLPIFGPEDGVIFRRKAWLNPNYRSPMKAAKMWDGQIYKLRRPKSSRTLISTAEIRQATHAAMPIVAQTEIADASTGLRAVIEFPVKTMNIHDGKNMYQVDTGPVAFPDLSRRYPLLADSLALAFVAFNAPQFADFVIEDITSLKGDAQPASQVRHYSRIVSLAASNRLYALED